MTNFNKQEIESIKNIIDRYRKVSAELYSTQEEAKIIQNKVTELQKNLESIKSEEDSLMSKLKEKYGDL